MLCYVIANRTTITPEKKKKTWTKPDKYLINMRLNVFFSYIRRLDVNFSVFPLRTIYWRIQAPADFRTYEDLKK